MQDEIAIAVPEQKKEQEDKTAEEIAKEKEKKYKEWIRLFYAGSQGASDGASAVLTAMLQFEIENPYLLLLMFLAAAGVSGLSAFTFQGRAIVEDDIEANLAGKDRQGYVEIPEPQIKDLGKDYVELSLLGKTFKLKKTSLSFFGQTSYTTTYALQKLMNRYVLFSVILKLFSVSLSLPVSLSLLFLSSIVKILFDLSNEAYEANEYIAQKFQEGAEPFYQKMFYPVSGRNPRQIFRILGSVDHAIVEDLAPWLGYVPKEVIDFLEKSPEAVKALVGLASVVGSGVLALLLFVQTYYFEGNHTVTILRELAEDVKTTSSQYLPEKLAGILQKTVNLMAPLHGTASAMPVFYLVKMLLEKSKAKWPLTIVTTLIVFLGVSIGTYHSEVKETKKELKKRILPPAPAPAELSKDEVTEEERLTLLNPGSSSVNSPDGVSSSDNNNERKLPDEMGISTDSFYFKS